ncbi:hypothetical protein PFWH6_2525 [Pseudomonas fluorescens WH6]|nr:hypothetical protein PFWH6_2525 [Pseudomonas fluorescens WH6]
MGFMQAIHKYFFTLLTIDGFWHPAAPFSDPSPYFV